MALSIQKRWEIIFLHKHEHGPKWGFKKIAKYLNIDKTSVKRWIDRYENTGDILDKEGRGHKKITSLEQDNLIYSLFESDDTMSLIRCKNILSRKGIKVSTSTISRRLSEFGFTYKTPLMKPLLSKTHMKKRVEWCNAMDSTDWNSVIFTEETTFELKKYKRKYWGTARHKKVLRVVKHPPKIHVWGCFSWNGFGKLYFFTGTLNAEKMNVIYEKALLPSVNRFGFDDTSDWWLQEDNDPKHMSNTCKKWKLDHNIQRLPWPSNSPDLAPIENIWSIMKMKVAEKQPSTIIECAKIINSIWNKLSLDLARKLTTSMLDRIEECKMLNGNYILY